MKYAIILPDGAADEPVEKLGGRTPLEVAQTPNMDWVSSHGRQGCIRTVPEGFLPGSDVATLSLLGYDPKTDYTGRAPLEAVARDIAVGPREVVFRCNFVTIIDDVMVDFTAGHISQREADELITSLAGELADLGCRFHAGVSYRNLMVAPEAPDIDQPRRAGGPASPRCTPPHDIPDKLIGEYLPTGAGANWVKNLMTRAEVILRDHDVNVVRRDLGENPATHIWLWGQGRPRALEPFSKRFGLEGSVIAAVDLIRGIAKSIGMSLIDVPGATGYLDTDYAAKGAAATEALDTVDLVVVHIEAPDEAGHLGDADAKVSAIERVDEYVVGPVLKKLRSFDGWKILIAPDHPTPVERRTHTSTPPPFCIAGHMVHATRSLPFTEIHGRSGDLQIDPGHELMEYFLRK